MTVRMRNRKGETAMASNKENRSSTPKTEGEKHQGVGVNTPAKNASTATEKKSAKDTRKGAAPDKRSE